MSENLLTAGYESLGADINKMPNRDQMETAQGVVSPKIEALALDMSDDDILALVKKWKTTWETSDVKKTFEKMGKENEKYYLGKQYVGPVSTDERAMVDNLIFESLEIYLPQVTRRNPDPMVQLADPDSADANEQAFVLEVKESLKKSADKNKLRLKLKGAAKHWAIYLLGVFKYSWDVVNEKPLIKVVRPQKVILDPEATIDEDGYTGNYVGEYRKMEADKLLTVLQKNNADPSAVKKIQNIIDGKTGTMVQFIEWWTAEYMCWTLGEKNILMKKKNPHWNYAEEQQPDTAVDDYGNETETEDEAKETNHFEAPKIPFSFLSIFNLGEQPVDKTSLIGQNLSNQDLINKRNKQITKNADNMNGGVVVSLARSGLTETQAKGVTKALQNGGTIVIPDGAPTEAISRYPSPGLPADIFRQLEDTRSRLADIFGTRGSSAAGANQTDTVRGKIMNRQFDTDRIGGGLSEYLEQMADEAYNWMVQLEYVYGEDFQLQPGATRPEIEVTVLEGSLLPKDSTTIANQAITLAEANKMSLIDMYKRLEYPNPEELAANLWLEINAPQLLYKDNQDVQQAVQIKMQVAQAELQNKVDDAAARGIKFIDLPPDGKVQLAAKAGITLTPESVGGISPPPAVPLAQPAPQQAPPTQPQPQPQPSMVPPMPAAAPSNVPMNQP